MRKFSDVGFSTGFLDVFNAGGMWVGYLAIGAVVVFGLGVLLFSVLVGRRVLRDWWIEHRGIGKIRGLAYVEFHGDPRDPQCPVTIRDLSDQGSVQQAREGGTS